MDDKRGRTLAVPAALFKAARNRDLAGVAACYAEDAVAISPMFGEARGRERIAATWQTLFSTFVDVQVSVGDTMVDDNRVAVFASLSMVDKFGWFGRAPTGGTINYRLVLIFTVVDGCIVRDERLYDSVGLLERLEKTRIDKELRTAREVQRALVPRTARSGRFCQWIGDSIPSRAIGGDFFEFAELPSGAVAIVLGDVSGKGPAAALLAALVQGMFAVDAACGDSPGIILSRLNERLLSRRLESRFVTLVYGLLSADGRLVYANAGHNPPFLLTREGAHRLDAGGTVLGAIDRAVFGEASVSLRRGDTLVMFTDGVTEARNPAGDEFGDDRLAVSLRGHADSSPALLLDQVFADVNAFTEGAEPTDDITVTVTRFL
jgi:ketosteroid isomerase-like protein